MSRPFYAASIGEILWDVFPNERRLGGAPANFAIHLSRILGDEGRVSLVSAVGDDDPGKEALHFIRQTAVDADNVAIVDAPTGRVDVTLNQSGSPQYEIVRDVAWDRIPLTNDVSSLAKVADVVCFGSLAQRADISRDTIGQFLKATRDDCLRVFDINLRPTMDDSATIEQSLQLANVLKLSDEELPIVGENFGIEVDDVNIDTALRTLADKFSLSVIALTCGGDGAVLMRGEEIVRATAPETNVIDTVGAGDSFTATMVSGLLQGQDLKAVGDNACKVAAYVCSQSGATPDLPDALLG